MLALISSIFFLLFTLSRKKNSPEASSWSTCNRTQAVNVIHLSRGKTDTWKHGIKRDFGSVRMQVLKNPRLTLLKEDSMLLFQKGAVILFELSFTGPLDLQPHIHSSGHHHPNSPTLSTH